jgi:protein-S-isoprenylcysteine O-methyltransferase Ste14
MGPERSAELPSIQRDATSFVRAGEWLFRHRTVTPIPLALALLALRIGAVPKSAALTATGVGLVAIGEAVRLWSVRHIGAISRTRSGRVGPLVVSGPFALVRNPLYLGNIVLWIGFSVSARLVWLAPIVALVLGLEYHAIVRWEERVLDAQLGDGYRQYLARVPRWIPTFSWPSVEAAAPYSWRDTIFSERGTLIAIAVGYGLLWLKSEI